MSTTNVPQPNLGPVGFIAPTAPAVLAGVQADFQGACGTGLNLALETPQGQLMSAEAAVIQDAQAQFLFLSSMMDPAYAIGRWQDAIGRYYFQTRLPALATTPTCYCQGASGVVIPQGAIITAEDSNTYTATATGTIPTSGTLTLPFACTVTGPIACPAQTFTLGQIIGGWDSCISTASAPIGANVESRNAFETRRALTVQNNTVNTNQAILGAILTLPPGSIPLAAFVYDNSTSGTMVHGGVTLTANSLYVCTYGGNLTAIAQAVWSKKPPGCAYQSGTSTITVQDTDIFYNGLGPSYNVTTTVASQLVINAAVTIPNSVSVPSNAGALITQAYDNAFSGADGGPPASQIGATTYASRFYAGIAALGTWAQNISLLNIGTGGSPSSLTVTSTIAQIPSAGTIALTLA